LAVLGVRNVAQVSDAVVVAHPIDVVRVAFGPYAVNVKPSQAVCWVYAALDAYEHVAVALACVSGCGLEAGASVFAPDPVKKPRVRVVVQ
jgi:hypothetical protein